MLIPFLLLMYCTYDYMMRDMCAILCTQEREKKCVIVIQRMIVSLLRLHVRYTLDTRSTAEKKKPYKPRITVEEGSGYHKLKLTTESLKMSRYVIDEIVDHRYTMRFLRIIDTRKCRLSNLAINGDDSNIRMIIIRCRNFYRDY